MQNYSSTTFVLSIADAMVAARFGKAYGIRSFASYLDFVDRRSTAHLDDHMSQRVRETAGAQRRKSRLSIENAGMVVVAVPMKDARTGATIWAEIDLASWFDVIESGADRAWFYAYKEADRRDAQVRCMVPLSGKASTTNATIARIVVNAKRGQQARTLDRNPLNLRRENLFLVGSPNRVNGEAGTAKTDTCAQLHQQKALRQTLAGRNFGLTNSGNQ